MTTYTLTAGEYFITIYSGEYATSAEAVVVAESFAKSAKMGVYRTARRATATESAKVCYRVEAQVKILADKTNGGDNETGIKRLKSIFKTIDKAGDTVELEGMNFQHTVASVEELRTRYGI